MYKATKRLKLKQPSLMRVMAVERMVFEIATGKLRLPERNAIYKEHKMRCLAMSSGAHFKCSH